MASPLPNPLLRRYQRQEYFYFILQTALPLVLVSVCLLLCGWAALTIDSGASSPLWVFIQRHGATLQNLSVLLLIVGLVSAVVSVIRRNLIELRIVRLVARPERIGRPSFWDAFPFASLVFFSVVAFTLCDLAASTATRSRAELLAMLGLYLVGAIVTSIVVLYGAHLVKFEKKVSDLTREILTAAEESGESTAKLDELTAKATTATDLLTKLEVGAGTAILSLETHLKYRMADTNPPIGYDGLDPYVRARSCHSIRTNEAVFLNADSSALRPEQLPVARNMISNFLEEMAWDLGQRRLVTNARNYTGFLVGAARGLEEYCERPENAANNKLRVFYLTHTVVTPAQLLNWPDKVIVIDGYPHRLCQPKPFMLEYMTYCRYFAAKRDRFIHGRLISALKSGSTEFQAYPEPSSALVANPSLFSKDAVLNPGAYHLPTKAGSWGIPHWGRVAVGNASAIQHFHMRSGSARTEHFPYAPEFPAAAIPGLFAAYRPRTQGTPERIATQSVACPQPCSLHWPLFYEAHNSPATDVRDMRALLAVLQPFLLGLENKLAEDCDTNEAKRELLVEAYRLFCERLRVFPGLEGDVLGNTDEVLDLLEFLQSFRWAFQHETTNTAWEDLRCVLFVLVNVLLAHAKHTGQQGTAAETLVDFKSWFVDTFHTSSSLARIYERDDNQPDNPDYLGDKEFALIGLIELERDDQTVTDTYVTQHLALWKQDTGNIKQLVGLRSSIAHPWKHAEVEWLWPCSKGRPRLEMMVDWYVAGLSGPSSQALC
jgi:hypothetical protein